MTVRELGSLAAHFCHSCAAGADSVVRGASELAAATKTPRSTERRNTPAITKHLAGFALRFRMGQKGRTITAPALLVSKALRKGGWQNVVRSDRHRRTDGARSTRWRAAPTRASR